MNYNEYMQIVIESEKGSLTKYPKVLHAIMGMNGEAGECVDILKKHIFQGHPLNKEHLLNELGDVCWYTMLLIMELDIYPEFIFEYDGGLTHEDWDVDIKQDGGLGYILDLNKYCGLTVGIYKHYKNNLPKVAALTIIRRVVYSLRMAANLFDLTLEDIFDINYEKIKKRYPDGFSTDMSVNRVEGVI